ncbi:erythromycin esterase family protein [Flavihumibacter petaseus]|uniref:Putative hydrolase n=1 Tax=Flavihumibacter petaseus NBRC 106054 TaxID=1220578 RepID=A0A0E9MYC4_9BACT|nr:erythromycin esterase family protein [Flavihumibacter petaseus]GAO42503.1 putative hydrolase [Flavihumibacter petaseus NBRC 106054]
MRYLLLFLSLSCCLAAYPQRAIKAYVMANVVRINSVSPEETNDDDLAGIGDAIGDARIVMLGEQDHGDAPAFLAKTRMIRYLHEKKGFNVLAFESDVFGLNTGWDRLDKNPDSVAAFLRVNIFPIWTLCKACDNLFYQYIPATLATPHPLVVSGFDNQMILRYASLQLTHYLDSCFRAWELPITKAPDYNSAVLPFLDSLGKKMTYQDPGNFPRIDGYLRIIREQAIQGGKADEYGLLLINSMIAERIQYQYLRSDYHQSFNARDVQMADNLRWLATKKYSGEKIIVWAANGHVGRYADSSGKRDKKLVAMGYLFTRDTALSRETYVLGFTSYSGEAGRMTTMQQYKVPAPEKNGFETWIDPSWEYAFVDFKKFNCTNTAREVFQLKGLGHQSRFKKEWNQVFDGIFYIRNMYSCIQQNQGDLR